MTLKRLVPTRLVTRLVLLMTLALFPLGLISIWQTAVVVKEAEALSRAALLAQTEEAAEEERQLVQNALGVAKGLAGVATTLPPDACSRVLQELVDENETYIFAGFVPLDGQMVCSTAGRPVDLSGTPDFESAIRRDGPFVQVNLNGEVSRQPVLIVSQPVRDSGMLVGRMTVSIPHALSRAALDTSREERGLKIASLNTDGQIIAATGGIDSAHGFLPANIALSDIPSHPTLTFRADSEDGRDRLFAISPLVDETLYLVGSWPAEMTENSGIGLSGFAPMLFPVLMWVAGISVAVLGLQHLVLRHLNDLRSAMRQFGLGKRGGGSLELVNPPQEFEEAERAFNRMTFILSEAEARQAEDIRDKEVLLKEVHHRVKNNLQLIASIMNMQMRRARSAEAKRLLAALQQRVRGLAMLHRTLYTTTDVATIDSRELIATVVKDASSLIQDHQMRVESDLASFPLYPDQAVPLSMLLAEALTNAFKYSDPEHSHLPVKVLLEEPAANIARLVVTNPVGDREDTDEAGTGDGLGSQLLKAFVRQLDGTAFSEIRDGVFVFEITFERREFELEPHV